MSGRMFKRRQGMVVSIRVNPEDCINILNVMDAGGLDTNGMTFPQMVSLCLGGLLHKAKMQGIIPEPDMFQYGDRMGLFMKPGDKKLMLGDTLVGMVIDEMHDESKRKPGSTGSEMNELLALAANNALSPAQDARLRELEKEVFGS